ncbi:MAG: hypothetical protein P1V81_18235 [Planctomycetota bacterium]|nr:hypothetical protein [Planctomycetota bacterium]
MQKNLLGLAIATALSSTAVANTDNSWLALDQEISNLSTNVVNDSGVAVSGFFTTYYESNSDTDTGGWELGYVRLNFKAQVEDFKVKVSTDLASGTASLKDAYVRWSVADDVDVTVGQFKRPFLYGYNVGGGSQLFLMRSANAQNEVRDRGFMVNGGLGDIGTWAIAAQNGADGVTDEHHFTARVVADVMGEGAFGKHEGGVDFFGAEGTHASVAVAFGQENDAVEDYQKLGIEAAIAVANFWAMVDMVDWSVDGTGLTGGGPADGEAPMGITLAYMFQEDVEVALRMDDLDNTVDTSIMTIGANYYQHLPHTVKWSLNFESVSSDTAALETDTIRLGMTLSF